MPCPFISFYSILNEFMIVTLHFQGQDYFFKCAVQHKHVDVAAYSCKEL